MAIKESKHLYRGTIMATIFCIVACISMIYVQFLGLNVSPTWLYVFTCIFAFLAFWIGLHSLYECKEKSGQYYGKWLSAICAIIGSWIFCFLTGSGVLPIIRSHYWSSFIAIVWCFLVPFFLTGLFLIECVSNTLLTGMFDD